MTERLLVELFLTVVRASQLRHRDLFVGVGPPKGHYHCVGNRKGSKWPKGASSYRVQLV